MGTLLQISDSDNMVLMKEIVVIILFFILWIYSIFLFYRKWNKLLNTTGVPLVKQDKGLFRLVMDLISKRHLLNRICKEKGSSKARTETGSPHHKNRRRMSAES